jgi:hypothetical protein
MQSLFLLLAHLFLVTLVYVFAYRTGYRAAKYRALSSVRKMSEPGSCLLEKLNETFDDAPDLEDKKDR